MQITDIDVNLLSQIKSQKIFNKGGYLLCDKCNSNASLLHCKEHNVISIKEALIIEVLKSNGINGLMGQLSSLGPIEQKIIQINTLIFYYCRSKDLVWKFFGASYQRSFLKNVMVVLIEANQH